MRNKVYVSNQSGQKLMCMSFNGYDGSRRLCREIIQPPCGGAPAYLDGWGFYLWDTVQVGVVYDINKDTGRLVYELFEVRHGSTLTLVGPITDTEGVIKRHDIADNSGGNIQVLAIGRTIKVDSEDLKAAFNLLSGATQVVQTIGTAAGMAQRAARFTAA